MQSLQVGASSGYCGDPNVNDGKNVTWTLDNSGTLTISGNGPMQNYGGSFKPWNGSNVRKVIIQSGVTSIGDIAFQYYSNLTSIEIPDSVTRIGSQAFEKSGLTSIEIPESVTSIDSLALARCSNLGSICFKGHAPKIDSRSFLNNTAAVYYPYLD